MKAPYLPRTLAAALAVLCIMPFGASAQSVPAKVPGCQPIQWAVAYVPDPGEVGAPRYLHPTYYRYRRLLPGKAFADSVDFLGTHASLIRQPNGTWLVCIKGDTAPIYLPGRGIQHVQVWTGPEMAARPGDTFADGQHFKPFRPGYSFLVLDSAIYRRETYYRLGFNDGGLWCPPPTFWFSPKLGFVAETSDNPVVVRSDCKGFLNSLYEKP